MKPENENLLIERIKNGDHESYGRLIDHYTPLIYNLCYRMLGNSSDADDATSMTFFNGYKNIKQFRGDCDFSSWLYRIGINTCKTILKKQKSESKNILALKTEEDKEHADIDFLENLEDIAENVEKKVIAREEMALLQKALKELPEQYLTVILLYDAEGKSYAEIAKITNTTLGTVKSRLNRGRKILHDFIYNSGNK